MVFSRSCTSKGRDSYPLVPEGPTTLEWLAGENIALRAKIEEQNAALLKQEELIHFYIAERENTQQTMENYYATILSELSSPIQHLMSRAEAMMYNSPASQDEKWQENFIMLCNEIRQVTELFTTLMKFPRIGDTKG